MESNENLLIPYFGIDWNRLANQPLHDAYRFTMNPLPIDNDALTEMKPWPVWDTPILRLLKKTATAMFGFGAGQVGGSTESSKSRKHKGVKI